MYISLKSTKTPIKVDLNFDDNKSKSQNQDEEKSKKLSEGFTFFDDHTNGTL